MERVESEHLLNPKPGNDFTVGQDDTEEYAKQENDDIHIQTFMGAKCVEGEYVS